MRRTRAMLAVLAAMLFVGTVLFGAPASAAPDAGSAAAAVKCDGYNVSNGDDGGGELEVGAYLKVGPYAECGNVVWMPAGTDVWYWCYLVNDYVNSWSYVRIAGTQTHGWVYDGHVDTGGAWAPCPPY